MRTTISSAPTPFDAISKEDRIAWFEQGATQALLTAVNAALLELNNQLLSEINLYTDDDKLGAVYRTLRLHREAYARVQSWILGAQPEDGRKLDAA